MIRNKVLVKVGGWWTALFFVSLCCPAQSNDPIQEEAAPVTRAPVLLDGETLFLVRGLSAFPAEQRAAAISERIQAAAEDPNYKINSLQTIDGDVFTRIEANGRMLVVIANADAALEAVTRPTLVRALIPRIDGAIAQYRKSRTEEALKLGLEWAVVYFTAFLLLLCLFRWGYRHLEGLAERKCKRRIEEIRARSLPVVEAERLWGGLRNAIRLLRMVLLLLAIMVFANLLLGLFPWTKPFSKHVFDLALNPLRTIVLGAVRSIPDLAFLIVLFLAFRFLIKAVRMFFKAIENGTVPLPGFDSDWAGPTYRLVRLLIIAFGLVVAYPYLPGSSSEAFKGVSLFIGVVFSLGSSGLISNILAGYSLIYRRAYKTGDRIRIGETIGDVVHIRLQVTHLRSLKNEEVIIPNSEVINSNVINYTSLAKKHGLILHTTVGIGYETPWRQVEAMLLLAAERTPGLLREPPPFILHSSLGDFCVTYELNVYCDRPGEQLFLTTALHRNILDVFNEYGVQIMTPAYEGDPLEPKVVPKDKWFEGPAKPAEKQKPRKLDEDWESPDRL